jgi:hypothetical protein
VGENSLEQASALMSHLFFDDLAPPLARQTFPMDSVRQTGNSIVTFARETRIATN